MTMDEVIKALEICTGAYRKCEGCPLLKEVWCNDILDKEALAMLKASQKRGQWTEEGDREQQQPTVIDPYIIAFNVLDSLSTAYYGKQMYFLRDNRYGPIYSRVSSKFFTDIVNAVNEFHDVLKGKMEADDETS